MNTTSGTVTKPLTGTEIQPKSEPGPYITITITITVIITMPAAVTATALFTMTTSLTMVVP